MIEILSSSGKLKGYYKDNYLFFGKYKEKKQSKSFIRDNIFYFRNKPALILESGGEILMAKTKKLLGYLKDDKILFSDGQLYYRILKTEGKFYTEKDELLLYLKGDLASLADIDYFGIACHFLEIFC